MLKDRVAELKAVQDQTRANAERTEGTVERLRTLKSFARTARERIRIDGGGYRRDHLRAFPNASEKRRVLVCPVLYRSGVPKGSRIFPKNQHSTKQMRHPRSARSVSPIPRVPARAG